MKTLIALLTLAGIGCGESREKCFAEAFRLQGVADHFAVQAQECRQGIPQLLSCADYDRGVAEDTAHAHLQALSCGGGK